MDIRLKIKLFADVINQMEKYQLNQMERYEDDIKHDIKNSCSEILKSEDLKDEKIIELIIQLYENVDNADNNFSKTELDYYLEKLKSYIKKESLEGYGRLRVNYEDYRMKIILYYEDEFKQKIIAYMAGSFFTDQEYRTFLANIQKGTGFHDFSILERFYGGEYNLKTIKDGYISRVKKATNQNTQDGYHADFILRHGRFFLLRENDNPVDIVYKWITKNTQAGTLEEWKIYLYNSLIQGGHIKMCEEYNYTGIELKGMVISDKVNTELIRELRREGLDIGVINIPRKPVKLDPSMSFIDVMNTFVIPHITRRESLHNVGDELSRVITEPIIYKKGNKLIKTGLFPRQKMITQGMLNAVKQGRNSIILNGGMGIGKTYMSIKLSKAVLHEHLKKQSGRIAVYAQSHLIPKWQRQFSEALPNSSLKFIQINGYKDVERLEHKAPEGIEVYLLPKDKVKRSYLERYASTSRNKLSKNFYSEFKHIKDVEIEKNIEQRNSIYILNTIRPSEMKLFAIRIKKALGLKRATVAKEIFDEEGKVISYLIATTSKTLRDKYGESNKYYDFIIDDIKELWGIQQNEEIYYHDRDNVIEGAIKCPHCGGLIYDRAEDQLSEDNYKSFRGTAPSTKSDKNKKCTNYIKIDGTPLTERERHLLIKGDIYYTFGEKHKTPYLDEEGNPVDRETLQQIKQGSYKDAYTIALKECGEALWTADDRKGYRAVNSLEMIKRKFGKNFFDINISDEAHLYSAESSQGQSFAKLCNMSKVNIALTGTLTGGKASHMFYTLYRMIPHKMSKYFRYNEVTKFIDYYGRRKKITKEYKNNNKYNKSGQGKVTTSGWNEIPGISPLLYSHFLSDIMVSRKIEDMGFEMPELSFYKATIEMDKDLKAGYEHLKNDILAFMKANKHLNLGGMYLNALLSYPDMPISEPIIYEDMLISNPLPIDIENKVLPKERELIALINRELKQERRSVVYITYTGTKEVDKRVEKVLTRQGLKVALLKSSLPTEKREKWIDDRYNEGVEVIITNPKLVQTGLDIVQYPTLIFFQLDYDVRVVRQAESRAWRVGQENKCKVYYMYYDETLQYDALKLIGSKKKASLALEGVFAEDILSTSGDDTGDSGAAALYKSLLGKIKLKEDDLDFFSEEEVIENYEFEETKETINTHNPINSQIGQLNFFTLSEDKINKKPNRIKKRLVVGQVSIFDI